MSASDVGELCRETGVELQGTKIRSNVTSALGVTVQLGYNPKTHSSDYISKEVNVGLGVRVRHGARLSRLVRLTVCVLQMIG